MHPFCSTSTIRSFPVFLPLNTFSIQRILSRIADNGLLTTSLWSYPPDIDERQPATTRTAQHPFLHKRPSAECLTLFFWSTTTTPNHPQRQFGRSLFTHSPPSLTLPEVRCIKRDAPPSATRSHPITIIVMGGFAPSVFFARIESPFKTSRTRTRLKMVSVPCPSAMRHRRAIW